MVKKRYGVGVRQVTHAKRKYYSTNNSHNSDGHLNNQFAIFPVLLQSPNQTSHLLADSCCQSVSRVGYDGYGERRGEEVALDQAEVHDKEGKMQGYKCIQG